MLVRCGVETLDFDTHACEFTLHFEDVRELRRPIREQVCQSSLCGAGTSQPRVEIDQLIGHVLGSLRVLEHLAE